MPYYDDNYGWYDEGDSFYDREELHDFYMQTQAKSVYKNCRGCGKRVKILPHYAYCNSCATKIEQGYDLD